MKKGITAILALAVLAILSCTGRKQAAHTKSAAAESFALAVKAPQFNADSAMSYLESQCAFGPRVPNTQAHRQCAGWLARQFDRMGIANCTQQFETVAFDGTKLNCFNIIGSVNPDCPTRLIVCSHWDSRPWADQDPDPAMHSTPVMGANDGASGVAVIMELARMVQQNPVEIGVDFILLDAEDWGPGDDYKGRHLEEHWGLGTQYWAHNPHKEGYKARYAILLDMVGGKVSRFPQELYSQHYAKQAVDRIWNTASALGYGNLFPKTDGQYITDDHVFINTIARIPAVDIVNNVVTSHGYSSFGPTWHTASDDCQNIDPSVMQAVGQVVATVIYNEKP